MTRELGAPVSILHPLNGNIETVIYTHRRIAYDKFVCGETFHSAISKLQNRKQNIMGDRSPKANQKKSGQKESKNAGIAATKKAAVVSKQAAGKKK